MPKLETVFAFLQVFIAGALVLFASLPLSNFSRAITPAEAIEQGYEPMPEYWEAGVYSHGSYTKWMKTENHPFAFSLSLLIFAAAFSYLIYAGNMYKKAKSEDDKW